ncbi:hypothetical protein P7C70_g7876, partial [Phenoliferia sp. Uapishka_3]
MELSGGRGIRGPSRRHVRKLLWYGIIALILNFAWTHFAWTRITSTSTTRNLKRRGFDSVDYAWGSILHRYQNHPRDPLPRPILPPVAKSRSRKVRTLIVTAELAGLHSNGGIGSAYLELAKSLSRHETMRVSILVAEVESAFSTFQVATLTKELSRLQVDLHFVVRELRPFFPEGWTALASRRVYDFFRGHKDEFDIIHFAENSGIGYFSALAKHQGLILGSSRIVVGLHGAFFEWADMLNKRYPNDRYTAEMGFFERKTAELADAIVSPSEYMLEYVRERGWALPSLAVVIPNVVAGPTQAPPARLDLQPITELVFFGRLEERKGIRLFVETLEQLFVSDPPDPPTTITSITFLGRDVPDPQTLAGVSSLLRQALLVIQNQTTIDFTFQFIKDYDRDAALSYLQEPHRLAVMPSLADNSPSTVLECISRSIRFIASDVGGVPELIHPEDRDLVLFKPLASHFAAKLTNAIRASSSLAGHPRIRAADETYSAPEAWYNLHGHLASLAPSTFPLPPSSPALVTICIVHYERPHLISQLLDSIHAQSYPHIELVLVDDGSQTDDSKRRLALLEGAYFDRPDWTMLRINNSYLGEARNRAAAVAKGTYIFFLDDDDVLKPHAVQTLVNVAIRTKASALSSWLDEFASDINPTTTTKALPNRRTYWFLGQSLSTGMLWNCFGSGNIFVRKDVFDTLEGFSTYREVGGEDWEFYMRLALAGHEQFVVPEEIIFVRSDPTRYSMKFAMDAWDAGYRALVPLLNDRRTQELGLAHTLMYAKSHFTEHRPPPPFADSRSDFQLVQDWNGWVYTFEPAGTRPSLNEEYLAVASDERWSTGTRPGPPSISQLSQWPYVSEKGGRIAAVRTFRSPTAMDVSVHISYTSKHSCGDGTRLTLFFRRDLATPVMELITRNTLEVPSDDFRADVSLEVGSTLHISSDPLDSHECDDVEIIVVITVIELTSVAWSNLKAKEALALRHAESEVEDGEETDTDADDWAPIKLAPPSETPRKVYDIALIFDAFRYPHAQQLIKSAILFIKSRQLFFHVVAPLSLHPKLFSLFTDLEIDFLLYDHALCYTHTRAVLPFSDPEIHISAHCKMFLSEIISITDRVLYLDTDVTITSDISRCYSEPERPKTLMSLGVDMGDGCQLYPDACWPIGLHWRVPDGLICGQVPSLDNQIENKSPGCPTAGELETVQLNGGVILFELMQMKDANFVEKYVQSVVHNYRIAGKVASWGEQDFLNSYVRLYPHDFEFLPCGCNYQWWGSRQAVKCGEQPVHIAHHWFVLFLRFAFSGYDLTSSLHRAHGIAIRNPDKPFNALFYHLLDNSTDSLPPFPTISPSLQGSPNASDLGVVHNVNCPRQEYDCTLHIHSKEYGQKVMIISRILTETFAADLVASIESQTYPNIEHLASVRENATFPRSKVLRVDIPLEADLESEYEELCSTCGSLGASEYDCTKAPLEADARRAFFDCLCSTSDASSMSMYELESLVTSKSWILYINDDEVFTSAEALAQIMAQVDLQNELIVFRSNTTNGDQEVDYRKKILPRSDLRGLGFLFHSSNLDLTDWEGNCGAWRAFDALSERLTLRWVETVPIMAHPFQHLLRVVPPADFGITLVAWESVGHPTWFPKMLDHIVEDPQFLPIINQTIVFSIDSEEGMFGEGIMVVNPAGGSGLAEIGPLLNTTGALLLSDSITLSKAALTALVNVWLDNPLRAVGPFSSPYIDNFDFPLENEPEDFDFRDESDLIIGTQPYFQVLPRVLITSSEHFLSLSKLLAAASPPLHPSCHGILLNAISGKASGLAPLRILLPDESFVDQIHNCRARNLPNVDYGAQPGEVQDENDVEPVYKECLDSVEKLVGPRKEWLFEGEEVAVAGPQGANRGVEVEEISEDRWRKSRKFDVCAPR